MINPNIGFGMRSWRYSMVVTNGVVEKLLLNPGFADNEGDPFEVLQTNNLDRLSKIKSRI